MKTKVLKKKPPVRLRINPSLNGHAVHNTNNSSLYNPLNDPFQLDPPHWLSDNTRSLIVSNHKQNKSELTVNEVKQVEQFEYKHAQQSQDPLGIRLGGTNNASDGPSSSPGSIAPLMNSFRASASAAVGAQTEKQRRIAINEMREINSSIRGMTNNLLMTRATWMFEHMLDPRGRDLFRECGYPFNISPQMYREMYDRDGITKRVVEVWPKESWESQPDVYEDEDEKKETEFEKAWKNLANNQFVYSWLERADILSGIGSFGVMLLGIDDGKPLNEPVDGIDPFTGKTDFLNDDGSYKQGKKKPKQRKINYFRCFDESLVHIGRWQNDQTSPRYAQPDMYLIRFLDYDTVPIGQTVSDVITHMVHWTRVIHFADNRRSSEVFGTPRGKPSFNRLLDLRKLYGGSAEMFWKGGFPGIGLTVLPELADAEIDQASVRREMDAYQNSLRRYFAVSGMQITTLQPNIAQNVNSYIDEQVQAITIDIEVPMRVFKGTEEGQLAGTQDSDAWDIRLQHRKNQYLTPFVVAPFVNRLVALGVLPVPKQSLKYHWPDSSMPGFKGRSQIITSFANAIAAYTAGGGEQLITPTDFFVKICGLDQREVAQMVENVKEYTQQQQANQAQQNADSMPDANTVAQQLGVSPEDAQTIIGFFQNYFEQQAQGGGAEGEDSGEDQGQGSPYQMPSGQTEDATGEKSFGQSGGIGEEGTSTDGGNSGSGGSGGVPWTV